MNLKKMSILTLMVMLGLFVCGMDTVAASHTTQIKVYQDYVGIVNGNIYIGKEQELTLQAGLHVDGSTWQEWFRILNFKVYDNDRKQIFETNVNTGLGSARLEIPTHRWGPGFYQLVVTYEGNTRDDYLPTERTYLIHVK